MNQGSTLDSGEITRLLYAWSSGDADCFAELVEHLYHHLRDQARAQLRRLRPGETLGTTALVNEAYLKLQQHRAPLVNRNHFFAVAASAMRHILVDHARAKLASKRGAGEISPRFEEGIRRLETSIETQAVSLLDLHRALNHLEELSPRLAKVVEYRFFGGMTESQIADVLNLTDRTVRRDWIKAKALLYQELGPDKKPDTS